MPPAFAQWLFSQQIVQSNHFAMVSTTEEGVDKIMAMAEAAGFSFANLMERVAVRQAWAVCRKQLSSATDNSTNASGSDPDAKLPKETEDDLQAVWDKKHSFVIPDGWMLMPSLQVKMWRAMTAEKRSMEVLLVEHLRPMSCSDRPVNQTLAIVAGRPIEAVPVMVDQVTRHIEIYTRTRAWFFTMAYIAARHPEFMDLQTAIYGSERVLHFLSVTYGNQLPPAAFFLTAWASTIHVFAETLRLTKTPLKEQICSPATWEHLWSGWQPTAGRSSNTQGADLPRELEQQVKTLKEDLRRWQSTADRYRIQAGGRQSDVLQEPDRKKKSGGGKGKGSGGGGGSSGEKRDDRRRDDGRRGGNEDNRRRNNRVGDIRRRG